MPKADASHGVAKVAKLAYWLDILVFSFLLLLVFFLPISNAIIEVSACNAITWWLLMKIILKFHSRKPLGIPSSMNKALGLYVFFLVVSICISTKPYLGTRYFLAKTLEYLAIYLIVIDTFSTRKRLGIVTSVLFASIFLVMIDAMVQYFTGFEFLRHRIAVAGRISGPFEFPDEFGNYLAAVLPIVLVLASSRFRSRSVRFLSAIALVPLFLVFFANATKGAWFGFFISLLFVLFLHKDKRIIFFVPALLFVVFVFLSPVFKIHIKEQFSSTNLSMVHRFSLWQTGWNMFMARPIFGHGLGTYMSNYNAYRVVDPTIAGSGGIWYAHNSYLQMLAETGIFGLCAFVYLVFSSLKSAIPVLRRAQDSFFGTVAFGVTAGIIAYLAQIFFDSTFYSLANAVLFWLLLSFVFALVQHIKQDHLYHGRA